MRLLLVDDEPMARARLERLILSVEGQATCVQAANGLEAVQLIETGGPWDAVFLDIEMPGLSGVDVLKRLKSRAVLPPVIFCTAFPRYAVTAFEQEALHYLVKPIDEARLRDALARLARRAPKPAGPADVLALKSGDALVPVPWAEIICLKADQKLTVVVTLEREFLTDESLDTLSARLPESFFRCHRAGLINLAHVTEFHGGAEPYVILRRNQRIPVARRRKAALKASWTPTRSG